MMSIWRSGVNVMSVGVLCLGHGRKWEANKCCIVT